MTEDETRHAGKLARAVRRFCRGERVLTPEKHQRVLERMGVSDGLTPSIRREEGDKIRVTSALWENAKVLGMHEALEVRNVDGRLHIARKERQPEDQPYDPYGLSDCVTRNRGDELIDD